MPCSSNTASLDTPRPRQLLRRAELAPARAPVAVIHQRRMGGAIAHEAFLFVSPLRAALFAVGVEYQTPAVAPDAVVAFDEGGKGWPGGGGEGFDGE